MLGRFPNVRRWADTDDVLQNAQLRLLHALETVRPDSTRRFFGLAAKQIRWELIDLARHFYGAEGIGANHASKGGAATPVHSLATRRPLRTSGTTWRDGPPFMTKSPSCRRRNKKLLAWSSTTGGSSLKWPS